MVVRKVCAVSAGHEDSIASRTTAPTMAATIMRQAIQRPAFRWYLCAGVNASAVPRVSLWTENRVFLTDHLALFADECAEGVKDFCEFV